MTTRVTVQISHAHQPVAVRVQSRAANGTWTDPMPATRIEREGDVCTFHVHANQRLQVEEVQGEQVTTGDGTGVALPPFDAEVERTAPAAAPKAEPAPHGARRTPSAPKAD